MTTPKFIDAFTAKVGVTVWPSASYNIDRAVFCGSKLRPFGCKVGRRTGVISMWGAYRPIKAAVPIPAGRPWWTGQTDERRKTNQGSMVFFSYWGTKSAQNKGWAYTLQLEGLEITKDHIASQPTFNRDGGNSVCTENLASLGTILTE